MHSGPSDRCAPRSKWISLHGPHGPVSAMRQKLLSSPASTSPQTRHPLGRQADLVAPDLRRRPRRPCTSSPPGARRDPQVAGQEIPGVVDRLALEVVAEAPVAEHLEERVVAGGPADLLEVVVLAGDAQDALVVDRPLVVRVSAPVRTSLNWTIPEFVKRSVCVAGRHEARAGHDRMTALGEELDEAPADLGGGQRLDPRVAFGDGGRHRRQWYRTRTPARTRRVQRPGRTSISETDGIGSSKSSVNRPSAPTVTVCSGSSSSRVSAARRRCQPASSGQSPPPSARRCSSGSRRPGGADHVARTGRQPIDRQWEGPVEQRVAVGLRLVERSVPQRDRDPAVRVARRPRVDETAAAVAVDRRAASSTRAEQLEDPDRPEARLAKVADRQQPEAAVEQPLGLAELDEVVRGHPVRQGLEPAGAEPCPRHTSGARPDAVVDRLPWVGETPHSVHHRGRSGRPYRAVIGRRSSGGVAVGVRREEVERHAASRSRGRAGRRPSRRPPTPVRRRAGVGSTERTAADRRRRTGGGTRLGGPPRRPRGWPRSRPRTPTCATSSLRAVRSTVHDEVARPGRPAPQSFGGEMIAAVVEDAPLRVRARSRGMKRQLDDRSQADLEQLV